MPNYFRLLMYHILKQCFKVSWNDTLDDPNYFQTAITSQLAIHCAYIFKYTEVLENIIGQGQSFWFPFKSSFGPGVPLDREM